MRMTVHLIATEDAGWMLPLFEPRMEKWERRRLEQLGMPAADVPVGQARGHEDPEDQEGVHAAHRPRAQARKGD